MAALSDTPTQPLIATTSEAGVSIKIEQGVFHENDCGSGFYHNVERRGNLNINYDSNHPPSTTENGSNTQGNGNNNFTDNALQTNIEIKSEPPVEIDDYHLDEGEENTSSNSFTQNRTISPVADTISPQIRLTPTSKLISLPNTTTAERSSQKRRYVCFYENCTKSYGKSSHLRSHLTWHTGIKPFVCQEPGCGKGFTRSDELNRHTRTHTGEKPFECIHCTKKFSRSDHLTKHLATHKKQSATGNGTSSKKTEKNPIAITSSSTAFTPTPLVISSVTENVESNIDFSEGMHFMAGLIENMHQKIQSSTSENLTDHVEVTTREHIKIKLEKPGNSDEYQVVPQKQETQAASSLVEEKHNLKIPIDNIKPEPIDETELRIKSEVMHENEPDDDAIMPEANLPPLSLDSAIVSTTISAYVPATTKSSSYVPASTSSPFVMTSINSIPDTVYDPSRPFPCSTCTKCFKRQDDLNRHMRTHTGEKPFACNECEKRFMRSDHLKKHMNTHTRVR